MYNAKIMATKLEMMKFSSTSPLFQKEKCLNFKKLPPLIFSFLLATLFFLLFISYSPNPLKQLPAPGVHQNSDPIPDFDQKVITRPQNGIEEESTKSSKCDLSKGRWVPDAEGPQYTNKSCKTIPASKNCFMHGRRDRGFLNWRWKPDKCELPMFHPKNFLDFVRGKTLAFVGDSVARNHMESLLCLLSTVETPEDVYKDSEDRNPIWYFPKHQFKIMAVWTKFLVLGQERVINGSSSGVLDLFLDKIDPGWSRRIQNVDYVIISDAHWLFRPLHLHNGTSVIGCVYCTEPQTKLIDVSVALKMVFRAAFDHINNCGDCKVKVTLVRTFSPAHFENGAWNTGGTCNRTGLWSEEEVDMEWTLKIREMQVEEMERARQEGEKRGRRFGILDVTRAMVVRGDGHPDQFWGNKWMKGYNDCVHWCLPGPIDVWNDFLMAVLREEVALVSQ